MKADYLLMLIIAKLSIFVVSLELSGIVGLKAHDSIKLCMMQVPS
jgi:hypothetical protein